MFVSPEFLTAAAAGAAIPLLLHLMQSLRRVRMPFPTVRFLRLARRQSSRRVRLEHLLLWLIRTAMMAVLGLAFAMPMLRSRGLAWLGNAPRDVAVLVDASYSMGYKTGRDTVWDKAIHAASSIIEGLGENDRLCLFLARDQPEALIAEPVSGKDQGTSRLEGLKPGAGTSQLAPALAAAVKALRKVEERREREIYILTDNQALPWQSFDASQPAATPPGPAAAVWNPKDIGDETALFVALLGVSAPENAWPVSVDLAPPLVRHGSEARVTAQIARSGRLTETTVSLFVDGEQAGRRPAQLGTPEASAATFNIPPLAPGTHVGRIETPADNLPVDNAFYFLIRVQEASPSLCAGTAEDTLFIQTALRAGAGDKSVAAITPDRIADQALDAYACVFLCNALPVSGQAITALENYVRNGGLLVFFPGMRANLTAYSAWTCLPGAPATIEEIPWSQRRRTLAWDGRQNAFLRPLREAATAPSVIVRRHLTWGKLDEKTQRLISMGADQPFLLDRPFGKGRVLMFAVAADRTWSDFPLSPFYLPLVLQCVDYGAGVGAKAPFLWATDSLPLAEHLPEASRETTLIGPDNKPVPIRSAMADGRALLIAEDLIAPGIYTISTPKQPDPAPALAVNFPRGESDLTPLPADEIVRRLGVDGVQVATDTESLLHMIEEHRTGRTYGEHLLWLALILTIIEFAYANALLRRGPRLSEQLNLDAAGHARQTQTVP